MSSTKPTSDPEPGRRIPAWFASPQRRVAAGALMIVVISGAVIAVADPFAGPSSTSAGVTDNAYPTSTYTVAQQNLTSQTSVSATLGYAGSYTVALPNGTSASTLSQAQSTVQSDASKVAEDERALATAKATAKPTTASTLLAAKATVSSDENSLRSANAQLVSDEQLNCPASSSDTVTSAVAASSSSGSADASSAGSSSPSSSTPAGTTGEASAHLEAGVANDPSTSGNAAPVASAPSASTGSVNQTTNTSTDVTGSVDPGGVDTTYFIQYGTSPNYGETTVATDVGSGTSDIGTLTSLNGLTPGATYHYRLVATNADGTDYGQDQTFTTNAAPIASMGTATTVSATSELLAGTVDPNGTDTTYYFEWGTSASLDNKTAVSAIGAGMSAAPATATITGLKAGSTYDFALVATSSLGTSTGATATFQTAQSSCVAEREVVSEDARALSEAKNALSLDELDENSGVTSAEQTLASDQVSLASDEQALSSAQTQVTNSGATFTAVPAVGKVINRGQAVYSLDGDPVPLFYGSTTLYRALYLGVGDGPDVAELQANLIALGFGNGRSASGHFSSATAADVKAWQSSLGLSPTGIVALGAVVVEPGPIEVGTVSASDGTAASAGAAVLTASSTTREVTISLDADQQSQVKVGDPVVVTLPDNSMTPGVISSVGTVATVPPSSGATTGSGSTPTITVEVTLTDPKATGDLDQAPVTVAITDASAKNALVVPVDALLALADGGYAVESVESSGAHQLLAVTLGLFDDAHGLVQVSGSEIAAGEKIVVPNT